MKHRMDDEEKIFLLGVAISSAMVLLMMLFIIWDW